jgi:hypothetical protein
MTGPIRFGVAMVGRCAWETSPDVCCGYPGVAVDLESGRSLCADHAMAMIGLRQAAAQNRPVALPAAAAVVEDALAWLRQTRRPPLEEQG